MLASGPTGGGSRCAGSPGLPAGQSAVAQLDGEVAQVGYPVGLVDDLHPENGFDQIFESDQATYPAELVDGQSEVFTPFEELSQGACEGCAFRDERDLSKKLRKWGLRVCAARRREEYVALHDIDWPRTGEVATIT